MENPNGGGFRFDPAGPGERSYLYLAIALIVGAIYLGCIVSPPSLMDDVDAVQAQIARNMLSSHDWVTARLDGIPYLEKAPLIYWAIAVSYKIFGAHDWAARIPVALAAIALGLLTAAFGVWAFGRRAGFYAGLCISTCVGLFLFTRILIPDVMLVGSVTLAMWAFLRALDPEEPHGHFWCALLGASLGAGLLLKSMVGVLFPLAAGVIYLAITKQLFSWSTWRRLHPFTAAAVAVVIAAPWHILATLRNPPYFAWTLHSGPGEYHGFLWFFFINEQVLRFLNLRYPRDYNTVPRFWFWALHSVWLFPWSMYLPAVVKLSYRPVDRAGRTRLLAACWLGFVLVFFTFSTTQEYYSMPCYPALALLLGSAMAGESVWLRRGTRAIAALAGIAALAIAIIYISVMHVPTPKDISTALSSHPKAYTLSLGHIEDLTLSSFAYLRTPLLVAGIALVVGMLGTIRATGQRAYLAAVLMMVIFFHAARLALVDFDPFMSSRPLAEALLHAPEGKLLVDHHYYTFSSIFFYTNRDALLVNGRIKNMEYGSYAPGAPNIFIDDSQLKDIWLSPGRCYLVASDSAMPRLVLLVGAERLNQLATSGGKLVLTNQPLAAAQPGPLSRVLPQVSLALP
jgi:4-amino-4-deoxy-L-arabinose transferase-like glycosyltransferase